LAILLIEIPFYSHFPLAYSMRFEPVHFSKSYRTIRKAHGGNPFQFSPSTLPYRFRKTLKILIPGPTAMVSISVILPTTSKCIVGFSRNRFRDQKRRAGGDTSN
jgi:hypothetical protein